MAFGAHRWQEGRPLCPHDGDFKSDAELLLDFDTNRQCTISDARFYSALNVTKTKRFFSNQETKLNFSRPRLEI